MNNTVTSTTENSASWGFVLRVLLKAALLFTLCNLVFAVTQPLEALGKLSLYNGLLPGRERLPYGENPDQSYNLSLDNIPAMLASHKVTHPKAADEFRVLILGDSGIWGWFLQNKDTLAAQMNAAGYVTNDSKRVVFYNLGYPVLSLTKDVLLLDAALPYQPDLILWPVTLDSFPFAKQNFPTLVKNNPERVKKLYGDGTIPRHIPSLSNGTISLVLAAPDEAPDLWSRTIVGQRRALADLLRLQLYGFSWAATGIDQYIPAEFPLRTSDFDTDVSWQGYEEAMPLTEDELALNVLRGGLKLAGNVPVLIVNEPIYVSNGQNSDLRYNAWYPRWAYDHYRELLGQTASAEGWNYLDVWDGIAPDEFTDSPVHLTPAGEAQFAQLIREAMLPLINGNS